MVKAAAVRIECHKMTRAASPQLRSHCTRRRDFQKPQRSSVVVQKPGRYFTAKAKLRRTPSTSRAFGASVFAQVYTSSQRGKSSESLHFGRSCSLSRRLRRARMSVPGGCTAEVSLERHRGCLILPEEPHRRPKRRARVGPWQPLGCSGGEEGEEGDRLRFAP